MPQHSGIGLGLLADVGNGPAVPEFDGMQGAGELVNVTLATDATDATDATAARTPGPPRLRRPGSEQRSLQVGR